MQGQGHTGQSQPVILGMITLAFKESHFGPNVMLYKWAPSPGWYFCKHMLASLSDMCGPYLEPETQEEEAQDPTEEVINGRPQPAASEFSACRVEINEPQLL